MGTKEELLRDASLQSGSRQARRFDENMNTTGCPAPFARDDLLAMDPLNLSESPCFLVVPVYAILLAMYTVIMGGVATLRTRYIWKRVYSRTATRSRAGRFGWLQILTITQSWLSCLAFFLLLIIPFVYGSENNVIVFIFGVQHVLYAISSERWLTKLIRLGSRIIGKRYTTTKATNGLRASSKVDLAAEDSGSAPMEGEEFSAMAKLERFDPILHVLMFSIRVMMVFLLISFCILTLVFPFERRWLLAGLGTQGYLIFASLVVSIYQYQRCKTAIIETQRRIKALVQSNDPAGGGAEKDGLKHVLKKFTRHQLILTVTGAPGWLIHFLWATSVIPINFTTILVSTTFDVVVNGSMFITFVHKSASSSTKKTTSGNDSHQAPGRGGALVAAAGPAGESTMMATATVGSSVGAMSTHQHRSLRNNNLADKQPGLE